MSEIQRKAGRFNASFLRRTALLGGTFLLLAGLTWLLYSQMEMGRQRRSWVTHTYQVLDQIHLLTAHIERAESAERGYLLTRDARYLEAFQSAVQAEESTRVSLGQLIADNPIQGARLDSAHRLAEARFSLLREAIAIRRNASPEAAISKSRAEQGRQLMDDTRTALLSLESEERRLLEVRSAALDAQSSRVRWILVFGSGSLLILLFIGAAVIERDSHHREMARQAIRTSEARLRLALDSANAGVWEWDLRTNANVWSDELWKLYGLQPNSCTPSYQAWLQVIHAEDRSRAEKMLGDAARVGAELNVEFRVEDHDGRQRWLLARGQPLRNAKGEPASFVGIALDITHRKQAEEALREREQNLRRFTDDAPVAIAMFDREMRYLSVSRRFREDYDLGERELVGRSHYDLFPEVPETWREIHRRCLAGAVERHEGERFTRADGSEQWIRWEIQPWRQSGGEIGGIVLFSEDITVQQRAEKALQESEALLRLAQQAARIGTFDWNIQTGVITWTAELEAMYGLAPCGFGGNYRAWEELVHPEDRAEARRHADLAIETGKLDGEWRVIWPDGTIRWFAARGSVVNDEAGRPLRLLGVNINITDAKQAELALQQTDAALMEAQRVAHLGSFRWDARTDAVTCSEEFYHVFGLDPQLPLPSFSDQEPLFAPESWSRLRAAHKVAVETGTGYELDLEVVRPSGESVWVTSRGEILRDTGGNVVGRHGTIQDVTRRKGAEDEILARNSVLQAINRVFSESLSCETEEALGEACLAIAEALTASKFGFVGEINFETGRLDEIATSGAGNRIAVGGFIIHGLYGRVILDDKGFYTNDPASHPDLSLPPGHPRLTAFLGVPLIHAGETIGMIAVGNREGGYRGQELEALEDLAPAIVQAFLHKRAEAARRASEAQFQSLANAIPQLCWMANADGWIYWHNARWFEYTGTTPDEMEGWGWQSVHDPEVLPKVMERWKASIDSGEPFEMVFPLRAANGDFHPFLTRIVPVRDGEGKLVQWFGTNTDITEQVRTQAALRRVSEHRRLALEAAELGAWDFRYRTGEMFWDKRSWSMFGVDSEHIRYEDAMARIHPEDRPHVEQALKRAVDDGVPYMQEFRVVWPDGSLRWIASHGRLHHEGENGKRHAPFMGVNMDITERKERELEIRMLNTHLEHRVRQRTAELEIANKELEAFSYSVSHDLRAPLRGIDGWSLALAEDYAEQLDTRAQKYVDRVRSETQRMGLLIDDMLQLSRVASSEMRFVPVDLTDVARKVAERLTEANEGRRIEFAIQPGLTVAGDARLLEIALTNLLSNAVKFTGPRDLARIEFGLTHQASPQVNGDGDESVFYVRDNGVGFDMTYAGALFGAFQRLHKASEFPGTGIGLAIVQRVIHRHGGRVWAEAHRDRGATFRFTIGNSA